MRQGLLTKEEAKHETRQNILLQSIGYSKHIVPEFRSGNIVDNAGYLVCSDGFYHHIAEEEMIANFCGEVLWNVQLIKERTDAFIELVKQRGEKDNISVALIKYVPDEQVKDIETCELVEEDSIK